VLHGLGVYSFPGDSSKVHLFIISHDLNGSVVHIFEHKVKTNKATLVKTVDHKLVEAPNDVTPTGPLSFYCGNDHGFRQGWRRYVEDKFGQWRWGNVIYCDATTNQCKVVATGFGTANGVLYVPEQERLVVADTFVGEVSVYHVHKDWSVKLVKKVFTGFAMDNVNLLPTGNYIIAGFPDLKNFQIRRQKPDHPAPVLAVVLDAKTLIVRPLVKENVNYAGMTAAAVDEKKRVFIGSGVRTDGLFVCPVDKNFEL